MKNTRKKILAVFGTRPEAIKMAPLVNLLRRTREYFTVKVCVTAQHRQMLDEVLEIFKIIPDYDLSVMQDGQSLYHITAAAVSRMEGVLKKEKPDLVLVHGDTTTTFAAALSAFYEKIPVGHVEAGLRSGDISRPFPEEANRILTDSVTTLFFAPTAASKAALLKQNLSRENIFITGNTVIDALREVAGGKSGFTNGQLKKHPALKPGSGKRVVLLTAHRRENFGAAMEGMFKAFAGLAAKYPDTEWFYPVHLNPRVAAPARRILGGIKNITLLPPLDYLNMVNLMKLSYIVVTDSGGLQEEAPSLGKPVLVLRDVTERPEAVKYGMARLAGTNAGKIFREIETLLTDKKMYQRMSRAVNPYGDGQASRRIVEAIKYYFGINKARGADFKPKR
ncbi:MAG TPA: UDP-N-acetylglucosamine 2-epimerase (non-hydrolyzing) [Elusimicrobia bacterium]|nr:MAG: UDP-N-acetylglucosamine 2-epimerase [Elusimicrobia bacterium RIFOXYA12_FULL_49_49]OGS14967.1 MAG: UDP-N-acetylglucosamine 2-epimerase [Elusimicrobia bacterium RIFOXYA2_FULL_47_53]OGS26098.1 MAG: UDP-N-acetylglucosamine 2-epimerase [Elusimicrobia bacterium RIFOXYB12_FULL_50_12]OGS29312.1 MAG: UDP-N-acetylglucosamine 2-epimerase [Elusimicrobia bacterium RIFOXYB2_FULL_46_23]HBU70336.1 UDP-N-acetylglucosamine 2-epimerase (non-hydrolyzing) [Elusimicrobiota bacterium]